MLMSGLTPTPPATKTTFRRDLMLMPGGGHTKLPPTRTRSSAYVIESGSFHSQAAGGSGDFCTASSTKAWEGGDEGSPDADGRALDGGEVIVYPPAFETPGT